MQPTYQNYNNPQYPQGPPINYYPNQFQSMPSRVVYHPQYTSPTSPLDTIVTQRQSNKWNLNSDNQGSLNNFPYGKEREKMYSYVSKQMQTSIDEENKKILEKFRVDAIKNRNQRVMRHLGKVPYITESMLPGTSVDASQLVEKKPVPIAPPPIYQPVILSRVQPLELSPVPKAKPIYQPIIVSHMEPPEQIYIPMAYSEKIEPKTIITPRKINKSSSSIGVSVDFEQQFPMKKKLKKKKRYYTIEQQEQYKAINKIEDMLHQINVKLKKNTELLNKSNIDQSLAVSRFIPETHQEKPYRKKRKYFQKNMQNESSLLPSIKYSGSYVDQKKRSKTVNTQNVSDLKQHLNLIKRNRKRMQDLDEYIYQ